jgi:hypothetical protein
MESPNTSALADRWKEMGASERDLVDAFRGFNAWSEPFRRESDRHEAAIEIGGRR